MKARSHRDVVIPYVEDVAQFQFSRRIRVVVDAGNGPAGPSCTAAESLNVDATELFFEMDGRFPNHHPDPTVPENLRRYRRGPRDKAELGIAFDGDADRIGAVDARRRRLGRSAYDLFAREISAQPGATFIGEVKCSQSLYDDLKGTAAVPSCGRRAIRSSRRR